MTYRNGPLLVTRPNTNFVFCLEIGQGATTPVFTSEDLEEAVGILLKDEFQPVAFMQALKELQDLGGTVNWEWNKIAARSEE